MFDITRRGKRKYYLLAGATLAAALVAAFVYPGWRDSGPPPKTIGADLVKTGAELGQSGSMQGTRVGAGETGKDVLTLAAARGQGIYTSGKFQAGYPFNALGLHWMAQVPAGADIKAEVRFSQDGSNWGKWQQVSIDDDVPDFVVKTRSAGETIGELVFADRARFFQYRLTLTGNAAGQVPQVSRFTASYIDAKGYHQSPLSISAITRRVGWMLNPPQASAEPGVISRAQWGADESLMTWTPEYATPQKIIVHHTVTQNWDSDPAATIRSIYYYHAVSLGWGDIGYNYLIDPYGNVYEGRAGGASAPPGQSVIGGHVYGWNSGSIGIAALGDYDSTDITPAMYNAFVWLITQKANQFCINPEGSDYFVHYDPFNNYAPVGSSPPNIIGHRDAYPTDCPGDMLYAHIPGFRADASRNYRPTIRIVDQTPTVTTSNSRPLLYADFFGCSIANPASISMTLDGADVTAGSTRTTTYASYRPPAPLAAGTHTVSMTASDYVGHTKTVSWPFTVASPGYNPRDYLWSWYDSVSSKNWVLMANPASSGAGTLFFDLYIGGRYMGLSGFGPLGASTGFPGSLMAASGATLTPHYSGVMGGPVDAASVTGGPAIVSQRVLWGQNSFEEVPGSDYLSLSSDYYWTWYDQQSPGFTNWVLVSDPNSYPVYYQVLLKGKLLASGSVGPGGSATPTFPGKMGGPLEARACQSPFNPDGSCSQPAKVIASQRVLSGGGSAFNEVPGIPASQLSDHYLWTWYDMQSPGAQDWVLVNNVNSFPVYYELRIAGQLINSGTVAPGASTTPTFPGKMGGPVELQAWTAAQPRTPAKVMASQRTLWGPSFEEVPGYPAASLNSAYVWTWYDQLSAGATNWVLVSNPNPCPVYYELRIRGQLVSNGTIMPGRNVTPTFPGKMGGPVELQAWTDSGKSAVANVMASQRVLWNGYFNEVAGSVFNKNPGTSCRAPATTVTSSAAFEVRESNGNPLTTLAAGQTAAVSYSNGAYQVTTSTGYSHSGSASIRMSSPGGGIMQVTSYHDIPSWNANLDDNQFRGTIEAVYSPVSKKVWVVNELPVEDYLKGIAETSEGDPPQYLDAMSVAARSYALWYVNSGGKYGSSEVFDLKNSRNGNGDDQQYKGYGLEERFPNLVTAVNSTAGQVVTYNGSVALASYFSQSDGFTRSALSAWGLNYPWLMSVPDPDCKGMPLEGHGVGLSAHGALMRASRGNSYQAILGYYYTNTTVAARNTSGSIRVAIAPV